MSKTEIYIDIIISPPEKIEKRLAAIVTRLTNDDFNLLDVCINSLDAAGTLGEELSLIVDTGEFTLAGNRFANFLNNVDQVIELSAEAKVGNEVYNFYIKRGIYLEITTTSLRLLDQQIIGEFELIE